MGQLTISITIFNSFWYVYQRVSIIFPGMGFMDIPLKTHGTGALKLGDVRGKWLVYPNRSQHIIFHLDMDVADIYIYYIILYYIYYIIYIIYYILYIYLHIDLCSTVYNILILIIILMHIHICSRTFTHFLLQKLERSSQASDHWWMKKVDVFTFFLAWDVFF